MKKKNGPLNRFIYWKNSEKLREDFQNTRRCQTSVWEIGHYTEGKNRKDTKEGSQEGDSRSCDRDREEQKYPSQILKSATDNIFFSQKWKSFVTQHQVQCKFC